MPGQRLCECGCGEFTSPSDRNRPKDGIVKGEPLRFIHGHNAVVRKLDPVLRFWAKVDKGDVCWNWTGRRIEGYGYFGISSGRHVRAHRFAYELLVGPIPDGLTLDHLCRNRRCVNPEHLEAVTGVENTMRGNTVTAVNARKTHCIRGHELIGTNVYFRPNGRGRVCRACNRLRAQLARDAAQEPA